MTNNELKLAELIQKGRMVRQVTRHLQQLMAEGASVPAAEMRKMRGQWEANAVTLAADLATMAALPPHIRKQVDHFDAVHEAVTSLHALILTATATFTRLGFGPIGGTNGHA